MHPPGSRPGNDISLGLDGYMPGTFALLCALEGLQERQSLLTHGFGANLDLQEEQCGDHVIDDFLTSAKDQLQASQPTG